MSTLGKHGWRILLLGLANASVYLTKTPYRKRYVLQRQLSESGQREALAFFISEHYAQWFHTWFETLVDKLNEIAVENLKLKELLRQAQAKGKKSRGKK